MAIPLATVRTSPPPAPLEKDKGVVIVPSDDEGDSAEGPVFKRRRTTTVAASHSSSHKRAESLRDHPPSASTPPNYLALEEGAETTPKPTPTPAPELPRAVQHVLRGYQQEIPGSSVDEALMEGIALSLGGFFARANSLLHQSEAKAKEHQALADELALVKGQMTNQAHRFFMQEAALQEALGVVRRVEEAANKKFHEEAQKYATLLTKVVPLRIERCRCSKPS